MNRVLLVEDDKWWAENCQRVLRRWGYAVSIVGTADEALQQLDEAMPRAIVLDYLLPGGNAMQLLHELQSYTDTRTIPVILCTSINEIHNLASALENYGVRRVFDKASVTPRQLAQAVKEVIV
jgi:two-component system, chemotaxis family, response regulator PixH